MDATTGVVLVDDNDDLRGVVRNLINAKLDITQLVDCIRDLATR